MHAAATLAMKISNSFVPARKPCLLAVDDDRIMLAILTETLEKFGYEVRAATSGNQGLQELLAAPDMIDAIILDQEMPGLNGLQVVEQMKATPALASIPVVMLTGNGSQDKIRQGIDAGVFYYMVKPANEELIRSVAAAAVNERRQKRVLSTQLTRYDVALKAVTVMQLSVRTLAEAENVGCLVASCFPEPERVVTGMIELLINAVEHGNLGLSYEDKSQLLNEGKWQDEIARRLTLPEYCNKAAQVIYQCKPEGWFVQITDEGKGFDWRRYWQIDPSQATASHGRGIARARLLSFDRIAYNEAGNQVKVMVGTANQDFKW